MPSIPSALARRLRDTLVQHPALADDRALRAVFVEDRLAPWLNYVPENTPDRATRVNLLIAALCDKTNAHDKTALVLLLHSLAESTHTDDVLHTELLDLAHTLETTPLPNLAMFHEAVPPTSSTNPFGGVGRITDPACFFDREEILRQIFEELRKGVNLSLVGESQIGKSSLLTMICAAAPAQLPGVTCAYLSLEWVENEDEFYTALCEGLQIAACRGYRLVRALQGQRYVLCLDEMEKMAWQDFTVNLRSQLRGLADGPDAPLKLVIASRSPLGRLFPDAPELDSPLAGICRHLDIGPFPPDVARAFLTTRLHPTSVTFTEAEITALIRQTGGHPARLQRAAADLFAARRQS